MKSIISITIFLVIQNIVYGQPILDRSNYFEIGDSIVVTHKFDISLLDFTAGANGENVEWNFSDMDFNHPSVVVDTIVFINPVGTPFYPNFLDADYSNANLCYLRKTAEFDTNNNQYNYLFSNNERIEFIGEWADNPSNETWSDQYPNPITEIVFPITYPFNYEDIFYRSYYDNSGGLEHQVSGDLTIIVEGYGTLRTPDNNIINNVIKIHKIESGINTSPLGVNNYTKHSYYWYSQTRKGALLSFEMSINNPEQIETASYCKQTNLGTIDYNRKKISISPNPTQNILNIQTQETIKEVSVYDMLGKKVTVNTISTNEIDVSNLAKGMYIVKVINDIDKTFSTMFIKN